MVIINEEEMIGRYIDILTTKRNMYQKKLNEIEKRKNIQSIFNKYPENPMKCLVELADSELIKLLADFMNIKSDENDIKVKKYWMSESNEVVALQSSYQYKEVKKIFENLLDKIQYYLDYSKDMKFNKQLILEKLNLISSLRDKLLSNEPIISLSTYFEVIKPNETLTSDDIYKYLSAISLNNLNVIDNISNKEIDVSVDKELRNYFIVLLEEIILEKEKELRINDNINQKIKLINDFIEKIENNYDELLNLYPTEVTKVMNGLWEENDIKYYVDRLALPVTIIKGKTKGLGLELSEEDLNVLNKFIETLKAKYEDLKKQEELQYNKENMNNDKEVSNINLLLTKLKLSSKSLLDYNDFMLLINCLKNKEKDYDYILASIDNMNAINLKKCSKELSNTQVTIENNIPVIEQVKEPTIVSKATKQAMKKIEILFEKYNFNYNSFSEKIIEQLIKTARYEHIEEMLEYISSTKELSFLKDYTLPTGNTEKEKKIQEIKCSQLCFILAYSNTEILENFLTISKRDKIELYDIFSIPKVFASKNNEELSGTYEDFIINEKYIKTEYPKILHELVSRCPFVLGTDSYLFRKNIELTKKYGMSIEMDNNGALPSPIALATEDFEYIMDRFIEVQDYDYIECFRSQLETNASVVLRLKYIQRKNIDFKENNQYDIEKYFDSEIEEYLENLSLDNMSVAQKDSKIKWLDNLNLEESKVKQKVQYILDGIYISRIKTLKYYGTLLMNNYPNKEEALLYSLVKDSYLTKEEFNKLKNLIYESEV